MKFVRNFRKPLVIFLAPAFLFLTIVWTPAQSAMVGTAQVIQQEDQGSDRDRLNSLFDRKEVRTQLEAWGVDPEIAKVRLDALTDQEVTEIAGRLDRMPAGGDALGAILGAALIVFFVLLITDILGFTNIFPFVSH